MTLVCDFLVSLELFKEPQKLLVSRNNGFPEDWGNVPIDVGDRIVFSTMNGFYTFDKYSEKAQSVEMMNTLFDKPPQGTSAFVSPYDYAYYSSNSTQTIVYKDPEGKTIVDSLSLKGLTSKRLQGFEDIRCLSEKHLLVNTNEGFSIVDVEMLKEGTSRQIYSMTTSGVSSRRTSTWSTMIS